MKLIEYYKVIILWVGIIGLLVSIEGDNWVSFGAFSLLALTAIIFKDATMPQAKKIHTPVKERNY